MCYLSGRPWLRRSVTAARSGSRSTRQCPSSRPGGTRALINAEASGTLPKISRQLRRSDVGATPLGLVAQRREAGDEIPCQLGNRCCSPCWKTQQRRNRRDRQGEHQRLQVIHAVDKAADHLRDGPDAYASQCRFDCCSRASMGRPFIHPHQAGNTWPAAPCAIAAGTGS